MLVLVRTSNHWLTLSRATLIAALVAAVTSLLTLALQSRTKRAAELRAAHRAALASHLQDVGRALHEATAVCGVIIRKDLNDEQRKNWLERAARVRDELNALRLSLRYTLWGIDPAIRALYLFVGSVGHYPLKVSGSDGVKALGAAQKVKDRMDNVVRRSYASGRPPTWYERRRLGRDANALTKQMDSDFGRDMTEVPETDDI